MAKKKTKKKGNWYCIAASALLLCSCVSTKNPTDNLEFWTYLAAHTGTQAILLDKPESRIAFGQALVSMKPLMDSGKFDAIAFHKILSSLPTKELKDPKASLLITTATILFQRYGVTVDMSEAQYIPIVMKSVYSGIENALNVTQ